jgi:hypothetical protein
MRLCLRHRLYRRTDEVGLGLRPSCVIASTQSFIRPAMQPQDDCILPNSRAQMPAPFSGKLMSGFFARDIYRSLSDLSERSAPAKIKPCIDCGDHFRPKGGGRQVRCRPCASEYTATQPRLRRQRARQKQKETA